MSSTVLNVPNQLTIARLVLAVFCFICLAFDWYLAALVMFVIAAVTDWVDGFWARRYGQITQLGRIMDPFADKIIVCGAFIFLAAIPPAANGTTTLPASEITAWMAVVVLARELLVTALRSFFEEHGTDFSAKMPGKWKMLLQCAAVSISLAQLWYFGFNSKHPPMWNETPPWWIVTLPLRIVVWAAIVMTIYSGWGYVAAALRLLRGGAMGTESEK